MQKFAWNGTIDYSFRKGGRDIKKLRQVDSQKVKYIIEKQYISDILTQKSPQNNYSRRVYSLCFWELWKFIQLCVWIMTTQNNEEHIHFGVNIEILLSSNNYTHLLPISLDRNYMYSTSWVLIMEEQTAVFYIQCWMFYRVLFT